MVKEYYLSWDCGVCALAYVFFSVERGASFPVQIHSARVIDLFADKPNRRAGQVAWSSDADRARRLYSALESVPEVPGGTVVYVEIQAQIFRGRNAIMSRAVEQQILFYYSSPARQCRPVSCRASAKLRLAFAPHLTRPHFPLGYAGNKRHAVENWRYAIRALGVAAAFAHIPRAHHDDIADAFMQGMAAISMGKK